MDERDLRRLRDDLRLMAERVQSQIDLVQSISQGRAMSRDWFDDALYRSCRNLGYSIQRQLKTLFRKRRPGGGV